MKKDKPTEKSLSEKKIDISDGISTIVENMYFEEDVKEFIRLLKDEMKGKKIGKLHKIISKLAGKDLR